MREYVDCEDCTAGIRMETGQPCRTCQGMGGWWLEVDPERFTISWEPHEGDEDEPP